MAPGLRYLKRSAATFGVFRPLMEVEQPALQDRQLPFSWSITCSPQPSCYGPGGSFSPPTSSAISSMLGNGKSTLIYNEPREFNHSAK